MQKTISYIGPRGWAILTLCGGAALACPFLRTPRPDPDSMPFDSPAADLGHLIPPRLPSDSSELSAWPPRADLATGRVVSGRLPSTYRETEPLDMPTWVPHPSKLDELVAKGILQNEPGEPILPPSQPEVGDNQYPGVPTEAAVDTADAVDRSDPASRWPTSHWRAVNPLHGRQPPLPSAPPTTPYWPEPDESLLEAPARPVLPRSLGSLQSARRPIPQPASEGAGWVDPAPASGPAADASPFSAGAAGLPSHGLPAQAPTGPFVYQPGYGPSGGSP